MCENCCSFRNLLAWAASLAGAVLLVLAISLGVDLLLAKPAPVSVAAVEAAKAPEPVTAPVPAPASETAAAPVAAPEPEPAPAAAADPLAPGKKVFAQCKACHSVEPGKNLVGPSLAGVVGRARASVAGFKYSQAMAASHDAWDEAALSKYLTDPKTAIPGNKMTFKGLASPDDRAAVIAYLKSLGAK